jgi:Sec-independent protein secretion pathway components
MIGTNELIIIALVILVLFGATAIPKFARSLGQAKKEFEKGAKEGYAEKEADEVASPKGKK